ncbi:MAG: TetR/AcrR family transcriptional regulator [Spirochaetota bacterium]|nr:TetR/AcrR family transcriptional regulator [Spirochaetota bacterium]
MTQNDTKELILDEARKVFARFGFKKATMDEIANATDKAKSSIYHYFASKETIFQKVVEKEGLELNIELLRAIESENTPQRKISAYIITKIQVLHNLKNYYSALRDEYLERYGFIGRLRKRHEKEEFRIIQDILISMNEGGDAIALDIETTSFAIVTALKGLEYHWAKMVDICKIEGCIDKIVDTLFYGIVKR